MINIWEVNETNKMVEQENLDVRTITIGISLLDCMDADLDRLNQKIYDRITTVAKDLVKVGKEIERDYCIPIVNKRISVTPIAMVGSAACKTPEDYVTIAKTLDAAGRTARLLIPEFLEVYEENCPAHHFDYNIYGAGYPYHHCFHQKKLSYKVYDGLWRAFLGMEHEEDAALRLAWWRLRYPVGLSERAEASYLDYLRRHVADSGFVAPEDTAESTEGVSASEAAASAPSARAQSAA